MIIEGNQKEIDAMQEFHRGNRQKGLEFPNCMRPIINARIKLLSELTEHTIANEIEPPKEVLRKEFQ